jgi:hypothetical protein
MDDETYIAKCPHLTAYETEGMGTVQFKTSVLRSQRVGISTLAVDPNNRRGGIRYEVEVCVICAAWLSTRLEDVIKGNVGL